MTVSTSTALATVSVGAAICWKSTINNANPKGDRQLEMEMIGTAPEKFASYLSEEIFDSHSVTFSLHEGWSQHRSANSTITDGISFTYFPSQFTLMNPRGKFDTWTARKLMYWTEVISDYICVVRTTATSLTTSEKIHISRNGYFDTLLHHRIELRAKSGFPSALLNFITLNRMFQLGEQFFCGILKQLVVCPSFLLLLLKKASPSHLQGLDATSGPYCLCDTLRNQEENRGSFAEMKRKHADLRNPISRICTFFNPHSI